MCKFPRAAQQGLSTEALAGHKSTLQTDQVIPKTNPTGSAGRAEHQAGLDCAEVNPQPRSRCFKVKLLLPVNPYME